MTDPLILYYFSEEVQAPELTKEAVTVGDIAQGAMNVGKRVAGSEAGKTFLHHAKAPLQALNPENLRQAWGRMSGGREIAARRLGAAAPSMTSNLRQSGWLADYRPSDLKGAGKALRYLPGKKAVFLGTSGLGAASALSQKADPKTGRKRGLGERVGRAGMGAATGLIASGLPGGSGLGGMVAGMAGGHVGEQLGQGMGGAAGRAVDTATSGVKRLLSGKKKPTLRAGGSQ